MLYVHNQSFCIQTIRNLTLSLSVSVVLLCFLHRKLKTGLHKWGLYESRDHYLTRSYLTHSINYPRPIKSQFICKHVNSYLWSLVFKKWFVFIEIREIREYGSNLVVRIIRERIEMNSSLSSICTHSQMEFNWSVFLMFHIHPTIVRQFLFLLSRISD